MKVLVSNIGSTSFKYRLFEMGDAEGDERELAAGGADRIGQTGGKVSWRIGQTSDSVQRDCADHGEAINACLAQLVDGGVIDSAGAIDAIGFKAVMAGDYAAVARVDEELLERMEYFIPIAPAHNPPYIAAMRRFAEQMPQTPLIAAFEPGFHRTIPQRRRRYAVPPQWAQQYGLQRYGFHGASHRYVAQRMIELTGKADLKLISCHLGGSSSVCASLGGESRANSFGLSPQSGLPQSNRAGDLDVFALKLLAERTGLGLDEMLAKLAGESGLAALSGTTGDARDIEDRAAAGDRNCRLALDVFATAVRDYIGAYLVELNGADAIAFAGGVGERGPIWREAILREMDFAGVRLDPAANDSTKTEGPIHHGDSRVQVWVVPTNEELIVARQARALLAESAGA